MYMSRQTGIRPWPRFARIGIGIAAATAAAIALPQAAHAGETGPAVTNGYPTFSAIMLVPHCSNGVVHSETLSFKWSGRQLHQPMRYQIIKVSIYNKAKSVSLPIRRFKPVPHKSGAYIHTYRLPKNTATHVSAEVVQRGTQYPWAYTSRPLSCAAPPGLRFPALHFLVRCDGSSVLTVDARKTSRAWSGTIFAEPGGFSPIYPPVKPGTVRKFRDTKKDRPDAKYIVVDLDSGGRNTFYGATRGAFSLKPSGCKG